MAGVLGITACSDSGQTAELLTSQVPLPPRFQVPLPIPPVKKAVRPNFYEITQKVAEAEIIPGFRTPIFGYDGIFPGPTIESRRGQSIVVRHRNELPVPAVVHLHGGHTPADSDGYPIDLIMPTSGNHSHHRHHGMLATGDIRQGHRDYTYPLDQPAATLWYHDHRMDFTAPQVWRGLAGFHLVRDDVEEKLPLPRGDREVPLMICDRAFSEDGSFRYPALDPTLQTTPGVEADYMEGVLGDVILVNGAPWPVMEVEAARYRFRVLNASNARRYRLGLSPGGPIVQIGSDGGLLATPVEHSSIDIASAERFDIIIDFSRYAPGTTVTMTNGLGTGPTSEIMRFTVTRRATDDTQIPTRLSTIERLDPAKATVTREWKFTRGKVNDHRGWVINGKAFDPTRMDARPKLGDIEIWRFITDLHHPVHVHLSPFQVISRGGHGPGVLDSGWKDTVDIRPAEHVDVAIKFTRYAGKFMLHCHNLEHEDMAMMSAFETVA